MTRDEVEQVKAMAREIAKEEIAKALAEFVPKTIAQPAGLKIEQSVKASKKSTKYE